MTVLIYPLPDKSNAGQDKLLHPIPRAFAEIAYFRSYSDDGSTYDSYLWCFISKKKYVKYCFYSIDCHDRTVEVDLRVISFLRYSSCRQSHGLLLLRRFHLATFQILCSLPMIHVVGYPWITDNDRYQHCLHNQC